MKEIKNQYSKYKLTLTPLTPIFIGSGETLNKTKYYYDSLKGIINVVDEKKLINFLSRYNLIDNFSEYLLNKGNWGNLPNWFGEKRININTVNIWKYQLKTGTLKDNKDPKKQLNEIKTFIKGANGLPYIPSSSLKGAIRTALLAYEILNNKSKYSTFFNRDIKIEKIEEEVFGTISNNIFRALRISDSKEFGGENLILVQRYDYSIHKKAPKPMPMFLECLNAFKPVEMSLIIDEEQNKNKYFTMEKIEKALKLFVEVQAQAMEAFRKNISEFGYMIDDEYDEKLDCNMCLGGASGFWSKSIVYALAPDKQTALNALREFFDKKFKNHQHLLLDKQVSPHALKMINDNGEYVPIGLCNLKIENK